jgi:hypothetical protein
MSPRTSDGGYLLIDDPSPYGRLCVFCVHMRGGALPPKCAAFPRGIPRQILEGQADHRRPFPGDKGIRYKPHPEAVKYGTAPPVE